jgi:LL-diaminopimelate aminotransferase
MVFSKKVHSNIQLSRLVEEKLSGLSPIQTIMKMSDDRNIIKMGLDPSKIISFGGGWCNHLAPLKLQEVYKEIIKSSKDFHSSGRYSSIVGRYSCREQICNFEEEIFNLKKIKPENIILGHSSTQLFHDLLRTVCNPGDCICFLDPTYANYINAVKCALPRSKISYIPALESKSWSYLKDSKNSLEFLKQKCQTGTKVCVIPVPDNPTSQIPNDDFLRSILEIMQDNNGFLIIDHAYKALWFDKMPRCYSWSPNDFPNLITIHSNSKWLSSLGRRLGWIEADQMVINGLEKINESVLLSPDTLHSIAAARFLRRTLEDKSLESYIHETRNLYKKTADILINSIENNLGWKFLRPKGGLYTCCPTPYNQDPVLFVEEVLKNTGVLLIPGKGFGPSMEKAVRISYGPLCYDHELIKEGIERIKNFL